MLNDRPPTVERRFSEPASYQILGTWELWQTLLDVDNSIRHGFSQCRLPTPGRAISVAESEEHVAHIEDEWAKECAGRNQDHLYSGAPRLHRLPLNAKVWLHEVITDQKRNRNQKPQLPPEPSDPYGVSFG